MESDHQTTIHYSSIHNPDIYYDSDGKPHALIFEQVGRQTLSVEKDPKTHGTNVIIRRLT